MVVYGLKLSQIQLQDANGQQTIQLAIVLSYHLLSKNSASIANQCQEYFQQLRRGKVSLETAAIYLVGFISFGMQTIIPLVN